MTLITDIEEVHNVNDLIGYFAGKLGWKIDVDRFDSVEDFSYEFVAADLGLSEISFAQIHKLRQLRPLDEHQRWGLFCVEFESKRFSVSALRKVLSGLVPGNRRNSNAGIWSPNDLLFLCEWGEEGQRSIGIAHFLTVEQARPCVRVIFCPPGNDADQKKAFANFLSQFTWPSDTADVDGWSEAWSNAFNLDHIGTVVGILAQCHYISWNTLCGRLNIPCVCRQQREELYKRLWVETRQSGSSIGVVCADEAKQAHLSMSVIYSKDWIRNNPEPCCSGPAELIGFDLYHKIMDGQWFLDGNCQFVSFDRLKENQKEGIIASEYGNTFWPQFRAYYYQKDCAEQLYRSGVETLRIQSSQEGIEELISSAEAGYPLAKFRLGKMCESKNPSRARDYFNQAIPGLRRMAESGSEEAVECLVELGIRNIDSKKLTHVENLQGMLSDESERQYQEAKKLLRNGEFQLNKAWWLCLKKDSDLQNGLNLMFSLAKNGYPLARYYTERKLAKYYADAKTSTYCVGLRAGLSKLIEKGNCEAAVALAYLQFHGKDGDRDCQVAVDTLRKLSIKGNADAWELLSEIKPNDVPIMSLDICAQRFGKEKIDGIDYVFVGELSEGKEGWYMRPVVRLDARPNDGGEYPAFMVECYPNGAVDGLINSFASLKFDSRTWKITESLGIADAETGGYIS